MWTGANGMSNRGEELHTAMAKLWCLFVRLFAGSYESLADKTQAYVIEFGILVEDGHGE